MNVSVAARPVAMLAGTGWAVSRLRPLGRAVRLGGVLRRVRPGPLVGYAARPTWSRRDTEGGLHMNSVSRVAVGLLGLLAAAGLAGGCGKAGSSGTSAPPSAAGAGGCAPVAGSKLVVLDDDKHLQNADNVIAAINAKAAKPDLVAALDKVADALDTTKLVALNKATDVDHKTSAVAAQDFPQANNLNSGISKGTGGPHLLGGAHSTRHPSRPGNVTDATRRAAATRTT